MGRRSAPSRAVGCTIGTASKWRVRFAEQRFSGLDETGERGLQPKYTPETDRCILAVLDARPPMGFARWTGPLIVKALGDASFTSVQELRRHIDAFIADSVRLVQV